MKTIRNALTFDVEHWYDATLLSEHVVDPDDHIERSVDIVPDVLQSHPFKQRFSYWDGSPRSILNWYGRSLTPATNSRHTGTHTPLFELTPAQFEFELVASS